MSPDPEQIDGFDHLESPQAWNGYAYVHNNPLNSTDPDGLDCIYSNGDGTGYVQRGDCTNAGGKDDNGVFVNGTIDVTSFKYNADNNSSSFNYTPDSGGIGRGVLQGPDLNGGFPSGSLAAGVFGSANASTWNNAAGAVEAAGMAEYRAAALFFPLTGLLIDHVAGAGSSGASAAAISRKPGSLGMGKGTDALRRENKIARDIIQELKLTGKDADAVHDIIAGASIDAGRKLGYRELVVVVKETLGLL
jgi:hypothetical protein